MKSIFRKLPSIRHQNSINIEYGIGRGIKQINSSNSVNINGVRLEVSNGMIHLYTDNKPYRIVVDGEIIRR